MTSVIAHEINNPLEAIGNLLYLLAAKVGDDTESQGYVRLIENELLRISGITKQTLRWSRESVQTESFSTCGALFEDVMRLYAGQVRNRHVTLVIDGGKAVPVYGQIGQITQVLSNLVSNAIQAAPVGGKVWLNGLEELNAVSLTVRDNGHGMAPETLLSIFQPFFTTKGDLGNGLGLYISKEIAERHGGSLKVKSEIGVGTEVRLSLPSLKKTLSVQY
jgi:signal transduction histidine kinase